MVTHLSEYENLTWSIVCGFDKRNPNYAVMATKDIDKVDCLDCLRAAAKRGN